MGKSKLKPCPFCGSSKVYMEYAPKHGARVACKCGACGPYGSSGSEKTAKNSWNRRASLWQPIETAPKDGTAILGWAKSWEEPEKILYVPAEKGEFHEIEGYWCVAIVMDDLELDEPTHWMPLPEVPKEDE